VLDQIVRQAKQEGTLFVVHTGDLITGRDAHEYEWVLHELAENGLKLPFCPVPGNHDCSSGAPGAKDPYTLYARAFGPRQYWFACDNALFVALDDSTRSVQPADLEWLDGTLSRLRPQYNACFVFMHIPLGHSGPSEHPKLSEGAHELAEVLKKWHVTAVFSGHIHRYIEDTIGGVPRYISGGGGGPLEVPGESHHYLLCRVGTDGRLTVEKKDVAGDNDVEYSEGLLYMAGGRNHLLSLSALLVAVGLVLTYWGNRRTGSLRDDTA
jgi:3',5'-cyclic AMP phosphodiesterase CpdA